MQAARLPIPHVLPAVHDDAASVGFAIGWDHAQRGLTPPHASLAAGDAVARGWAAGRAAFGRRTMGTREAVRSWLRLRLEAWQRGVAFEPLHAGPGLLARIAVTHCPITGEALTDATGTPTDATVERVNPRAAWAAGNLVVMSRRAARAKGHLDWLDAAALGRQLEMGGPREIDGLTAAQWSRLAVLMSWCTPLPHGQAAALPLLLLPPPRLRVLNPVQALQLVLTLRFVQGDATFTVEGQPPNARAARIERLAKLFPADARTSMHAFMTTLLARKLAGGPAHDAAGLRAVMERGWTCPLLLRRWQRLALRLTPGQCERIVDDALAQGLVGRGVRTLSFEQATDGWALDREGRVDDGMLDGAATHNGLAAVRLVALA